VKSGELLLLGERDPGKPAHVGIERSLAMFNAETGAGLSHRWVATAEVNETSLPAIFGGATGVWCTPGSPYASTAGALLSIRRAREQQLVFLGTCGGFQHALMEYCGTVLGHRAAHQEQDREAADPLIVRLSCSLAGVQARVMAAPGSWYARTVGSAESVEEFNCNYGVAPSYERLFVGSDLEFVARDEAGQVRAFRLHERPFYVGTLFQPERRALRGTLHPLVRAFFEAVG
jgi:CTP synthase (UTP-ammonia lyase)